jgi:hypothetical protein
MTINTIMLAIFLPMVVFVFGLALVLSVEIFQAIGFKQKSAVLINTAVYIAALLIVTWKYV